MNDETKQKNQFLIIRKEEYRIVIILPLLRIAIKFARVCLADSKYLIIRYIKFRIKCYMTPGEYVDGAEYYPGQLAYRPADFDGNYIHGLSWTALKRRLKIYFFEGIKFNWSEFMFYWKTQHPLLEPIYFSILGFINIQRIDRPLEHSEDWFKYQVMNLFFPQSDSRFFYRPPFNVDDCCVKNGRLSILNYNNKKVQRLIKMDGMKLFRDFDPNDYVDPPNFFVDEEVD